MKILLLGKDGQVGWELQRSLAVCGPLVALDRAKADLGRPDLLRRLVRDIRPDLIVNAAAYTAVDQAEGDPRTAFQINATAPGILAEEAELLGSWLLHYSTDYVFNGSGSHPWQEADATGPLNVYGASKLAGERAVSRACSRHLILRTSWVYGARGQNFAKILLRRACEQEALAVIHDQIGAPTGAELIADVTAHLGRLLVQERAVDLAGIYHIAAAGETSWYDYARFVLEVAQSLGTALKLQPAEVTPIPASAYPAPAPRPANSRLDCRKIQATFGVHLPHWQEGVQRMLDEHLACAAPYA